MLSRRNFLHSTLGAGVTLATQAARPAAARYPGRFAVMGRVPLNDPGSANRLPTWKQQPGVLGIRLNIAGEQAAWLTDGTADRFWPAAEKAGVPVMFLTTGQTPLFGPI